MPQIQTVDLELQGIALTRMVSQRAAMEAAKELKWANPIKAEAFIPVNQAAIVAQFITYIAAQKCAEHTFKWPLNWLEAVKERFAPKWALKRWPVRYRIESVKVSECYPRYALPNLGGGTFKVSVRSAYETGSDLEWN